MKDDASGLKEIDYDRERIQSSGSPDIMAIRVARYVDAEAECADLIRQIIYKRHLIICLIQRLKDRSYSALLFKRYVEHKNLETISQEIGLSYDHTRRIHSKALREFDSLFMEK